MYFHSHFTLSAPKGRPLASEKYMIIIWKDNILFLSNEGTKDAQKSTLANKWSLPSHRNSHEPWRVVRKHSPLVPVPLSPAIADRYVQVCDLLLMMLGFNAFYWNKKRRENKNGGLVDDILSLSCKEEGRRLPESLTFSTSSILTIILDGNPTRRSCLQTLHTSFVKKLL